MTQEDLAQIQSLVTSAQSVLVLTHQNPSVDTMASVLAIYLSLLKMGKNVTVAMESQPLVEVSNLVGIDKVKTALDGKNLLITYKPYILGDFEKVSYMEDAGTTPGAIVDSFKLTITPRDGFVPDPKNFNFSYTGAGTATDLIVTVDVLEPTLLGRLYDANLFAAAKIINIDNHDPNKDYGRFNLVEPEAATISEIVTFFLRAINVQLDADIANNLYQGIVQASQNFQSAKVAAATFEAAAICLRAGAKQWAFQPMAGQLQSIPMTQPQPVRSQPMAQPVQNDNSLPQQQAVPADWTQPKAYRGTSTV